MNKELQERWDKIPEETQKSLIEWYNVVEESFQDEDFENLIDLWENDQFKHWECPECGEELYEGNPDEWGAFQGVCQTTYSNEGLCENCYNTIKMGAIKAKEYGVDGD